ncbi:hypothetical protein HNP77_001133 [Treponema rectale]|uniref:RHS repeat-associated core domain-containing protein n=1 Tax=Treponema rectale TaxID=744512 RepID=A0A840SD35_9SPIR|nr:hypothetical protein [Treponema rectale]MBB5218764.1 hypothetical protein [Treponema rectale]
MKQTNFYLYHYAANNPIKYIDPTGRDDDIPILHLIGEIEGYPETGDTEWRAANDQVFIDACNNYNSKYNLSEGDDGYVSPRMLKAQAMVESGGANDKDAFLTDPLQVNNYDDWVPEKARICGLTRGQEMTPETSAAAALEWRRYKGYIHDNNGNETEWEGDWKANYDYNGNRRPAPDGSDREHREWYADREQELSQ